MREWINLFEAKMFSGEYAGLTTPIYQNPTLSDLRALVSGMELRGITDGKNLFVWDANKIIHSYGARAIGKAYKWQGDVKDKNEYGYSVPIIHGRLCCYFFNPHENLNGDRRDEWVGPEADYIEHYVLAPDLSIALEPNGIDYFEKVPAFQRISRNMERI